MTVVKLCCRSLMAGFDGAAGAEAPPHAPMAAALSGIAAAAVRKASGRVALMLAPRLGCGERGTEHARSNQEKRVVSDCHGHEAAGRAVARPAVGDRGAGPPAGGGASRAELRVGGARGAGGGQDGALG